MHDHDSSLLKLQIRGTWMYRMTMVVLIFEIEPVPKIFESHHWVNPLSDLLKGYSNKGGNRSENRKREKEIWKWGITENNAFQMLKREVCKQVELAYADFKKPKEIGDY